MCEQLLSSQLRLKTAWCFGRWAQRACEYDACCARWRAVARAIELTPRLGACGWRVQLHTRVHGEARRRARSLWRAQHALFTLTLTLTLTLT